ncbi:MAG: PilZ domain-containing protein [Candidatus Omnitrophica bacterium]|nr:PilZ domain-containing protein [Candidatus Omnitrophota bacterium]
MKVEDLKKIKKVSIFVDNEKINGEIIEIDKWGKMIISVPSEVKTIPVELGKRGEIFFEEEDKKFFISGKIFSQGIERMVFLPETDILTEKRKDERYEVPFLPAKLKTKTGILHKEEITGNIINISLSGAKIETQIPLKENFIYDFETTFYIRHKPYPFYAKVKLKHIKKVRNIFLNGINFIDIDYIYLENLKKYIKELKHELKKDSLNY